MPMLWPGSDNHLNHPAHTILRRLPSDPHFDLIVIGGGAAGLACAVVSAQQGCKTLVVEASDYLGGTSAYSAGTLWVPNTHLAAELGAQDNFEKAAAYLDRAVGNNSSKAMRDTFLTTGAEALETLEQAGMHFRARPFHPDYLSEIEGSTSFGRALEAVPFDGRLLGPDFSLIRPPIPEFTVLGGMMVDRDDVGSLLSMTKSTKSLKHSISIVGRYFIDRLRHTRGTRLVMGNALIGQLLLAARKAGVEIAVKANVVDIEAGDDIVGSVVVEQNGVTTKIRTARGVVLATGGFAGEASRRDAVEPPAAPDFGPAAPRPAGRIYEIALRLGGHFGPDGLDPFFWAPCSVSQRTDGTKAVFPHFVFDRSKPGTICVGRDGKRFVNESISYHQFARAMFAADEGGSSIPAYLIADALAVQKYGLGMVRPGARGLGAYLKSGYVMQGSSAVDLARQLGIDEDNLKLTIARINEMARDGVDADFGRGSTIYQRANGDPSHRPNPTLGELASAPYYAVKLWPCIIGSSMGLVTDENGRVLRPDRQPVQGLYAIGNDMQSVMGGAYPGPGITLGPAVVFGYRAARHAINRKS